MTLALFTACGGDDDGPVSAQPLACVASTERACACTGGATGVQSCDASGAAYGPCMGCPAADPTAPPAATPAMDGTAGAPAAQPATPGVDVGVTDPGTPGSEPPPATMTPALPPVASEPDAGAEPPLPVTDDVDMTGPSCGVGLPKQCELGSEKCCVRSLETDTCIPEGDACNCGLSGCSVLEVFCDGPEDCEGGQVCCGTLAGSSYSSFTCEDSCDYRGSQRIACHEEMDECPAGDVCANSQLLTNVQVCIDPATIQQ